MYVFHIYCTFSHEELLTLRSSTLLFKHWFVCACVHACVQLKGNKEVLDKKQSQFSLKKMIRRLHIKEPADHVMAILGRK